MLTPGGVQAVHRGTQKLKTTQKLKILVEFYLGVSKGGTMLILGYAEG
jgi:hypothetical protein